VAIYTDTVRVAAGRAADWLEANRDKHITGQLALTTDGHIVPPADPKADCFCALGRLAKELSINVPTNGEVYSRLADPLGKAKQNDDIRERLELVYEANDEDKRNETRPILDEFEGEVHLAGMAGVNILRKIANDEEII